MHRSQTTGILHSQVKAHVHSRTKQWDMLDSHGEPSPMVHICAYNSRSYHQDRPTRYPTDAVYPDNSTRKGLRGNC